MKLDKEVDPFDIVSGKVVQNLYGTFWFKSAGNNIDNDKFPIADNLYRADGAVIITGSCVKIYKLSDTSFKYESPDGSSGSFTQILLNINLEGWAIRHTH